MSEVAGHGMADAANAAGQQPALNVALASPGQKHSEALNTAQSLDGHCMADAAGGDGVALS